MAKEFDKIKPDFDWKYYVTHNELPYKTDYQAWHHFRNVGYKEGLLWKHQETNKILVVMPTFNRSQNIVNIIKMIVEQKYTNWTFLIIDDGSTEKHKKDFNKIKQLYNSEKRIIFLENNVNCHIGKTLNRGIQYFLDNEEYTNFTWVSDDNEYYPNFLKELVNTNTYFTHGQYKLQQSKKIIGFNKRQYLSIDDLLDRWNGCAAFMWTKEAIKEIGFYKEDIHGCED